MKADPAKKGVLPLGTKSSRGLLPAAGDTGRPPIDKLALLDQAQEFVDQAMEKTGEHSTPWMLVDPKLKHQFLLRVPGPTMAKLEYVMNFHPDRKRFTDKTQVILRALEAELAVAIDEIGTPSARRVAQLMTTDPAAKQ